MTCNFSQTSEQTWVAKLNLTMSDKAVLESPDGIMLMTDKHVDVASKLLFTQFPHLQGLQSSPRYQPAGGLTPITFSGGFVPEGFSQNVRKQWPPHIVSVSPATV